MWDNCVEAKPLHNLSAGSESYSDERRHSASLGCGTQLDFATFVSDARRLNESLFALAERQPRWPHVFLRSVAPQHFAGSKNGVYDLWRHAASGCVPIVDKSGAYERNSVLNHVFRLAEERGIVKRLDTWLFDVDQAAGHHDAQDCTHYCQGVTYHRLTQLLAYLVALEK